MRNFPRLRQTSVAAAALCASIGSLATTPLADKPIFNSVNVPGNMALTVSVEFPTAISVAHPAASAGATSRNNYSSANNYIGYFDPNKCYLYNYTDGTSVNNYFYPAGAATDRTCSGKWSGNFLNWALMQTIDPFRWALTGGYRVIDTNSLTVLEKAWSGNQGGAANFPDSTLPANAGVISGATPFNTTNFRMSVRTRGNKMRFIVGNGGAIGDAVTGHYTGAAPTAGLVYEVFGRVRVCDASPAAGGLESNCRLYSTGFYKPEGLLQEYSDRMRYSVFGYLNDSNLSRDGGVLRANQKFIGPMMPVPGSLPTNSPTPEWDAATGVMLINPNPTEATQTTTDFGIAVSNSGVMNYLNKFGQIAPGNYKTYDPVGELHYAALRYYRNLGNVASWTNMSGANAATKTTWIDGFPVLTKWSDPIQYSCQKNFILGIGDVNTHADRNLPGATGSSEPSKPTEVSSDTGMDALASTNKVGVLHGLGANLGGTQNYGGCCNNNGALMAGLAYLANASDIRADLPDRQSVQTYWVDVLENSTYKANNQYYLAAKYGGFTVPEGFDAMTRATDIPEGWWRTNTDLVGTQPRPDNYFTSARADQMVAGLTKAFASIASKLSAFSSAFSSALPQVATSGTASFATQYNAKDWTGELTANAVTYDGDTGIPVLSEAWKFSAKLETQTASGGWDTKRRIVSFDPGTKKGVPFRAASLPAGQLSLLDTTYRAGVDSGDYLNYLRGDRTHETNSSAAGSSKAYRARGNLIGDIVNSRPRPVSPPTFPYSDSANTGYAAFKTAFKDRPTMIYFGTNQGMVHGVNGSLSGAGAGQEVFAYVPSALFAGPTGEPAKNGLQSLGKPDFEHYNQVDATPIFADIDMGKTPGGIGTNWRTVLIGGLGKGGRSVYALDITDPLSMTSESVVASRVLWEFTHPKMGYSFGEPAVVKTKKYGWTVFISSGHNNSDGKGYVFVVNPRNGDLLETIETGAGSLANQAGLTAIQAFIPDVSDGTADALYAGDLIGNLWRVDLTETGDTPAPIKLAELRDSDGKPLPVTAKPLVVIQPGTLRRWVTVGTGRLLSQDDLSNPQPQRFFAIIDGANAKFWAPDELPTGFTYPIAMNKLRKLVDIKEKINLDFEKEIGWYLDLGVGGAGGPGWRVINDSTSYNGIVAFSTMIPSSTDVCAPSGSSRVYAIDLGTGSTRIKTDTGYDSVTTGVVVDLSFRSVAGKPHLYYGDNTGKTGKPNTDLSSANAPRRLNWREVSRAR